MYGYSQFKKLYIALIVLLLVVVSGITGFAVIEGYTFEEALYMTVITVSTVGFQEVRPLSSLGRIFTLSLIIVSFGIFAYSLTAISTYLIDGEFRKFLVNRNKNQKIRKLENHVIICGFGRNGNQIANELQESNQEFLVIDKLRDDMDFSDDIHKIHHLIGDATEDRVLIDAGINRAKAIITTLPDDADNVFVVLTARQMNPNLLIISRASIESSYRKLRMAGADNVVMPDKVGGTHMASLVLKPDVIEFFNHLSGQNSNISLEEITYQGLPGEFKNRSIRDLEVRKRCGANIIGLKSSDGKYTINPNADSIITEGTKIFVLGTKSQLEELQKWD